MPLFSVVVPTYNRRERLARALASVCAQRFGDHETVVVDDGSTDGTCESLAAATPGVRLVRQQNRGAAAARNAGVRHATGAYVAFLDSDDVWPPWTLERYAALIETHRPTWLYGRRRVELTAIEAGVAEGPLAAVPFASYGAAAAQDGLLPIPSGVAVRRDAFLAAGGFHESLRVAEDVDLWFRLGDAPGFVRMDEPVAFARETRSEGLSEDLALAARSLAQVVRRERQGLYTGDGRTWRAIVANELMGYAWQCRDARRFGLAATLYATLARVQWRNRFRDPAFGNRRNRYLLTFPVRLLSVRLHDTMRSVWTR